jgi:hypothetical protein
MISSHRTGEMPTDDIVSGAEPFQRYIDALAPLFDPVNHMRVDRLFEFVCCLIRAGGIEDQGWDPIVESTALIEDLDKLSAEPPDPQKFKHPERTRARLALLSYCHLTEADFFYHVLANLARLRAGHKYNMVPFFDLRRQFKNRTIPPSLSSKISRVNELAAKINVDTKSLFEEIYYKDIRNSVFHADYTITDTEFRMLDGLYKSSKGYLSHSVTFAELDSILRRSFAFYSAVMALHRRARRQLSGLRNKLLPYDGHYKGLLELLFEDDLLCGFRTYWPNGSNSEFTRTHAGCSGVNTTFEKDGSINFMVGLYASKRGSFSPLVEQDGAPRYTPAPGRAKAPHWPDDLKAYDAE